MILSRYTLKNIDRAMVVVPDEALFALPEKVLQFGTDALLRAVPDYIIDKANRQGIFNGRIVAVKLNIGDDAAVFEKQDGLYTHCILDVKNGEKTRETIINSSISRVLIASEQWNEVLETAHSRDIQIIISNAGELGLQLVPEDMRQHPPKSYPGKLLSFLYERFHAFGGSAHSGMIILPIELISDNGKKLESVVLELAHLNGLEEELIEWLENHNSFCNSMADRIAPSKPKEDLSRIEDALGCDDHLLITSEDYCLWAIEGDERIKEVVSFAEADSRVVVKSDIGIYRELKLYLLNATHTLASAVALFSGCQTVSAAMQDKMLSSYITNLIHEEIASAFPDNVDFKTVETFSSNVLSRFRNPHIEHPWLSITINYSAKMKARCIPVLVKHYEKSDAVPQAISLGFAGYIYFMKAVTTSRKQYFGEFNGEAYLIEDEQADIFYKRWTGLSIASLVQIVLSDAFWGVDLLSMPGFKLSVIEKLNLIINNGMREAIESIPTNKVEAA
jgi:tagaturonate reductase